MSFLRGWLEDPVRFARLRRGFYVSLGVIAAWEAAVPRLFHGEHAHFGFEDVPAWGSAYGLVSCVVIILGSKLVGHAFLTRREDYYD